MKKILLIDDSEFILEGTSTLLQFEGYEVLTAHNGTTGVAAAIEHLPDLIICDVSMPDIDGFEVLRRLRENKSTESTRFIFLTARAEKSDMRTGMASGADDYLIKPFTVDELLTAIETQWKKTEAISRNFEEIKLNVTYALPHEFRTALNQIIGTANFLKSGELDSETLTEISNDITASAKRLLRITENFLVYAQLESLSADPNARAGLSAFTLEEAGATIADVLATKVEHYNRTADFTCTMNAEGVSVGMSSENLNKIFDELSDNACKFSLESTPISATISQQNSKLVVELTDSGRGMTQEQISSLSAFKQFDRMMHEQQGVGLGLVIAKKLTELHGGEFAISSSESSGTTIRVVLPTKSIE